MTKYKIDLKKIINIKTLKELETEFPKYDNPIFLNNYIFHYFITLGNIEGLKLKKFAIYKNNNDNMNGFHLAAKEYNFEILCYLIETYPDYIYNRTPNGETFIYFMPYDEITRLIKKYPKLKWIDLMENNRVNLLETILSSLKYKDLLEFIRIYKIDFKNGNQYLEEIINNKFIDTDDKIKILDMYSDEIINYKNYKGEGLLITSINNDDFKIFKYLLNRNIDINYYYYVKNNSNDCPLIKAINIDISNNKYYYSKELVSRLRKQNIYYEALNKLADTITHSILYFRISYKTLMKNTDLHVYATDYELDKDILNECDTNCWNQLNVDYITPLEILTRFDTKEEYELYSDILLKNKIKIESNIYKKIKETVNHDNIWIKLYTKLDQYTNSEEIIIKNYPYVHSTLFYSKILDNIIFSLYLIENYSDLYLPRINSYQLKNITFDDIIFNMDKLILKDPIFPFIILYSDVNTPNAYIHPYLNNLINATRYKQKKRFAIVFLVIDNGESLHSNVLIYDFKNMIVERFEPDGSISAYKDIELDDLLEEELTWNTGLKYMRPSDYLPNVGFQTISNENYVKNKKTIDLGGYCLAWVLWYIETKMKNPNINSKVLVLKAMNNILSLKLKYSEYIRNYSNKINEYRMHTLKSIGIDERDISNLYITNVNRNKIINYIVDKLSTK